MSTEARFWRHMGLYMLGECSCTIQEINASKLGTCAQLAECTGIDGARAEALRAEIERPAGVVRMRQGELF